MEADHQQFRLTGLAPSGNRRGPELGRSASFAIRDGDTLTIDHLVIGPPMIAAATGHVPRKEEERETVESLQCTWGNTRGETRLCRPVTHVTAWICGDCGNGGTCDLCIFHRDAWNAEQENGEIHCSACRSRSVISMTADIATGEMTAASSGTKSSRATAELAAKVAALNYAIRKQFPRGKN